METCTIILSCIPSILLVIDEVLCIVLLPLMSLSKIICTYLTVVLESHGHSEQERSGPGSLS